MARDPDLMRDVVRRLRAAGSPIHPQVAMAAMEDPSATTRTCAAPAAAPRICNHHGRPRAPRARARS